MNDELPVGLPVGYQHLGFQQLSQDVTLQTGIDKWKNEWMNGFI